MALPRKHCHSVVEYVAATLHALIQPVRPMLLFVNWNGKGLATAVIHGVDNGNLELIRVLGKMMGARHA